MRSFELNPSIKIECFPKNEFSIIPDYHRIKSAFHVNAQIKLKQFVRNCPIFLIRALFLIALVQAINAWESPPAAGFGVSGFMP